MQPGTAFLNPNMARPPVHDKRKVCEEIFSRMRMGESCRKICKSEGMPHWSTFMDWIAADKELTDKYCAARERMVDAWVIDAYDTAHDETRDYQTVTETVEAPNGTTVKTKKISDNSASMRDRLKVDTILKVASRLMPRKYSERLQQEISGPNGEAFQVTVNVTTKQKED